MFEDLFIYGGDFFLRKGEVLKRLEVALLVRFVFLLLFMAFDIYHVLLETHI